MRERTACNKQLEGDYVGTEDVDGVWLREDCWCVMGGNSRENCLHDVDKNCCDVVRERTNTDMVAAGRNDVSLRVREKI